MYLLMILRLPSYQVIIYKDMMLSRIANQYSILYLEHSYIHQTKYPNNYLLKGIIIYVHSYIDISQEAGDL